jgi:aminopeptidase N
VWEQFFSERRLTGLERDSLDGSIPIDLEGNDDPDMDPAPTPSTAPIVYNKGASVLRMLTAYLGEQQFKQAIHDYLSKFLYDSASSEQFWEMIESTTGKPVADFASKWTNQPGYPLITVEHQDQTLLLTQKRFSYRDGSGVDELWVIPLEILFFLQDGTTHNTRIDFSERSIQVPLPRDLLAYKLNLGFSGFYRVHYQDSNLEQLGALIHEKRLSEIDSLNVLSDLFSLVKAGKYSIEAHLRFVETHLSREERPLPLVELCSQLSHIYRLVKSWRSAISHLAIPLFEQALEMIGYQPATSESILITELRTALLQSAFLVGSVKVLEFGKNQFQALLDGNLLSNDLLQVVLKIGAATHPQAQAWLTTRVTDPNLPEGERGMALDALGNSYRKADVLVALELNLLDRIPRSLRKRLWIEAARNPACSDWMWSWTLQHLPQLESLPLSHLTVVLVSIIPIIGIGHRSEVESCLQEISAHFPSMVDCLQMALEILEVNEKMNIPG